MTARRQEPHQFSEEEMNKWICPLDSESPDIASGKWRWAGDHWQHYHGYPIGHEPAVRKLEHEIEESTP